MPKSTNGDYSIYCTCSLSEEDFDKVINHIRGDFGGIDAPLQIGEQPRAVKDVLAHVRELNENAWSKSYVIVIDRKDWQAEDGVLLLNMDFLGHLDGIRVSPDDLGARVLSLGIGNEDWDEIVCDAEKPCYPEEYFVLYGSESLRDHEKALAEIGEIFSAGQGGRKKGFGNLHIPVSDVQPSSPKEAAKHFAGFKDGTDCDKTQFLFVGSKEYEAKEKQVTIVRLDASGGVDQSKSLEAAKAGELLTAIYVGIGEE